MIASSMVITVASRNGATHVNNGQDGKDKRLENADKNMQRDENDSGKNRQGGQGVATGIQVADKQEQQERQAQKRYVEQFADQHIDPETHRQGEQAGKVTNQLDGQHERRERERRAEEVLPVAERAMMADTGVVVIQENDHGAGQRDGACRRRGGKPRHQADQVTDQNKHPNAANHRNVSLRAVSHHALQQVADTEPHRIGQQDLQTLLGPAGPIHGKAALQPEEKHHDESEDHEFHGDEVRNGILRVLRVNMKRRKKRGGGLAEQPVDQLCYAENVFFHDPRNLLRAPSQTAVLAPPARAYHLCHINS